ncbi:uncharacterized protein V1510DRAFT_404059 [Dipodascopsis tothii]|uniref:uncharacterized protein n=1 Tax=Dipodascopsis tothii TaxID=44089 RepID=UPI0034CFF4FF
MAFRTLLQTAARRGYSTEPKKVSPHVAFYINFGRPLISVFAITGLTYVGLTAVKWKLAADEAVAEADARLETKE